MRKLPAQWSLSNILSTTAQMNFASLHEIKAGIKFNFFTQSRKDKKVRKAPNGQLEKNSQFPYFI